MAIDIRVPQEPEAPRTLLAEDGALSGQGPEIPGERLAALYKAMSLARRLDEQLGQLLRQGRVSFHLPGNGEEAVSAATAFVLGPEDWLFPAFRDVPAYLVRGVGLDTLAHQAFGTAQSPTLGRPLPIYFADRSRRIATPGAGGATHLPHAVGAAWAAKLKHEPAVALVSFNQGAVASGEFHAALNFAGVFKAPVVFVCRNQVADTDGSDGSAPAVAARAKGYGITGVRVDGTDILALVATLGAAVDRARTGGGPTLVEVLLGGPHSRDPVELLRRHLAHRGEWDEPREDALSREQQQLVGNVLRAAAGAGPPPEDSLTTDVFG